MEEKVEVSGGFFFPLGVSLRFCGWRTGGYVSGGKEGCWICRRVLYISVDASNT